MLGDKGVQRIRAQDVLLPHFSLLGVRDDPPGQDVLSAIGALIAIEGPHVKARTRSLGRRPYCAFICADGYRGAGPAPAGEPNTASIEHSN
ncbi:hypothetical protein D3C81_688290 [compost metagenome]